MIKYKELPRNPVEVTIRVIGCRWKILIIKELLAGNKRFNELKKGVTGISQKVLTAKLRELEIDEIIKREVVCEKPLKVKYSLSEVGCTLLPVINSLNDWGKDYKKYIKLLEKMS